MLLKDAIRTENRIFLFTGIFTVSCLALTMSIPKEKGLQGLIGEYAGTGFGYIGGSLAEINKSLSKSQN